MRSLLPGRPGDPDLRAVYAYPDGAATGSWVRANFVVSLDGAIEVDGRSGVLGGPGDQQIFATLRDLADVVVVGSGTVTAEGYGAAEIHAAQQDRRRAGGQLPVPPIAVVTSRGLPSDARLLEPVHGAPRPIILTTGATARGASVADRARAEFVDCGAGGVDLAIAIAALAERGLRRVLCEGGPRLVTELTAANLLDELCLTLAPVLAGPERAGLTSGQAWSAPLDLDLTSVLEQDGDLYLRYSRHRSDSPSITRSG